MTASGTSGNVITFTRSGASNGAGLYFYSGGNGAFNYCIIEYNSYGVYTAPTFTGGISLSHSTIQNNGYGVQALGGAVNFTNNEIINNTTYGVYLNGASPSFGNNLSEWNDIYGNGGGANGRDLRNGPSDIEARYVYWGTVDESEIQTKIQDQNDDLSLGVVNYCPWTNVTRDQSFGPSLSFSTTSVDVGIVDIGSSATATFTVTNNGSDALCNITSSNGQFTALWTMNGTTSLYLIAGQNEDVEVTFSPTVVGWEQSILTITPGATGCPATLTTEGIGRVTPPTGSLAYTRIAFQSNRDGNWEIHVMDADGTNPTRLTTHWTDDEQPSWSPDGAKIAVAVQVVYGKE